MELAEDRLDVLPRKIHNQPIFGDIPVIVQIDKIIPQTGRKSNPGDPKNKTDGEDDLSLSHFSMALFYLSGDRISHFLLKDHFFISKIAKFFKKDLKIFLDKSLSLCIKPNINNDLKGAEKNF